MSRLLNKTLRPLTLYALLVLALSIPVYYLIVDFIWVRELDKHHQTVKTHMERELNAPRLSDSAFTELLPVWNRVNPRSVLEPVPEQALRGDSVYTVTRYEGPQHEREQFRCLVTYMRIRGLPYRLRVETNMEETDETLTAIAGVAVLFFLVLLIGFVWLNRRLSAGLWKPFYQSLDQLRAFNLEGGQNIPFAHSDIYEFEALNRGLERLIEKNISVFRQQKEFTENASHELQTPLAVMSSKLDVLLQSDLSEAQYETVESLNRTLGRAYRINRNLLLVARIENGQFVENTNLSISKAVEKSLELLEGHINEQQVILEKDIKPGVFVQADETLLQILINNLLLNAVRHNSVGGKIKVVVTNNCLEIYNSGNGSLDPERLFKRFATGAAERPGSGLGLAIVKQVAQRYGWETGYHFRSGMHLFFVRF